MIARRHLVTVTRSIQGGRYGWLVRWLTPQTRKLKCPRQSHWHQRHSHWCATQAEAVRLRASLEATGAVP